MAPLTYFQAVPSQCRISVLLRVRPLLFSWPACLSRAPPQTGQPAHHEASRGTSEPTASRMNAAGAVNE